MPVRPSPRRPARRRAAPLAALLAALAGGGAPLLAQRPIPEPAVRRPPGPETVHAARVAHDVVRVSWSPVEGATAYDVARTAQGSGWQRVARVDGTTLMYEDRRRDLSQPHVYRVVAVVGSLASLPVTSDTVGGPAGGGGGAGGAPGAGSGGSAPAGGTGAPAGGAGGSKEGTVSCMRSASGHAVCSTRAQPWEPRANVALRVSADCPSGMRVTGGGHSGLGAYAAVTVSASEGQSGRSAWVVIVEPIWGERRPIPAALAADVEHAPTSHVRVTALCDPV